MADILKATMRIRTWLTKNELTIADHEYYMPDRTFTQHTHQRAVLAAATATPIAYEFDLGGMADGYGLALTTDRAVQVAINSISNLLPLNDNGALFFTGTFTHVYVRNNNTTYQATVEVLAFTEE